jgi:type IV pilus assembly protein PilV
MRTHVRKSIGISAPRKSRGVGLIEVLIAVLVMGIGMLGIAALQATSLRNSQSSLERGNAVIQTYTILDAMRANQTAAAAGSYNLAAMTCSKFATPGSLAQKDINNWIDAMHAMLGDSTSTCGQINCTAASLCTVTVQWDDSRGSDGSGTQQIQTVSQL